jgi:CMP-N-acetylneuraminic acid synthetase
MKSYTALVCARSGSKGLPGKNIRRLAGKPLIGWAIDQALAVSKVSRVIVSTDSEEIAAVARAHGAALPFLRPAELARDDTPEWHVWQHALRFLNDHEGRLPAGLVVVPPTAPLRGSSDIERCIAMFEGSPADIVITVTDAHRNPYFNMVAVDANDNAQVVMTIDRGPVRRQDAPVVYDMATVAYVACPEFVLAHQGLFEGVVRAVHVPRARALDIDTLLDFRIAECLMNSSAGE